MHNNIFFSFAVDADIEQLSKKRPLNSISATEKKISSEKVSCTEGTCDGAHNAEENSCNESPLVENEQATYASANNDLKGTKLYQEADVPGLYNLAMAIIDYRGHRVVAQVCTKVLFLEIISILHVYILIACIVFHVCSRVFYQASFKGINQMRFCMVQSIMARKYAGMKIFTLR